MYKLNKNYITIFALCCDTLIIIYLSWFGLIDLVWRNIQIHNEST